MTRLLRSVLHGSTPTGHLTPGVVPAARLGLATSASYLPATRASRIHRSEALRAERGASGHPLASSGEWYPLALQRA